jgi:hypothetical protein
MGLIKKIFGGSGAKGRAGSTQFADSQGQDSAEDSESRNAAHRDLVRLTLRETMQQHGIPSDWMDCRTLFVPNPLHQSRVHVQFLVRKADRQLLGYVHAFQESFWQQLLKADKRARDWLSSVGWEFYGQSVPGSPPMPDPTSWQDTGGDTQPPDRDADELASDLEALQALMSQPTPLTDLPPAAPRAHRSDT